MSRTPRNLVLCLVCLAAVSVTSAFLITRAANKNTANTQNVAAAATPARGPRNLFLQPEALRVSRRLGKRFGPSSRSRSTQLKRSPAR